MFDFSVFLIEDRDFLWQIYSLTNMTTTNISIQDFTQREIVCCISPLIFAVTQEKQCLDEELALELWTGQINFTEAEYVINNDGSYLSQKNNLWGLYDNDEIDNPVVDYKYETKEQLIEWYYGYISEAWSPLLSEDVKLFSLLRSDWQNKIS